MQDSPPQLTFIQEEEMGMVFGIIMVETSKYQLLHTAADYEIRKYSPCVVAQVTYDPAQLRGDRDGGFMILVNYIGAAHKHSQPQNCKRRHRKPEKIAMTAPIITMSPAPKKIATTAPVITSSKEELKSVTMQFVLPSKYAKAEDAPWPVDNRVVIREEGERKYSVVKFSGVATDRVVGEKVEKLRKCLERDGHRVVGDYLLARYNPPMTLPRFRTNEVMLPIE